MGGLNLQSTYILLQHNIPNKKFNPRRKKASGFLVGRSREKKMARKKGDYEPPIGRCDA